MGGIGTATNGISVVGNNYMSDSNSSTTPLDGDASFVGEWIDITKAAIIYVTVTADQNSATNGVLVEFGNDFATVVSSDVYTYLANSKKTYSFQAPTCCARVTFINGSVAQSAFSLTTMVKSVNGKPSSHRIEDPIVDDDDAELTKAVLTAKSNGNGFVNIRATKSQNLRVTDAESGLAIASGDVVDTTFIHKFGEAPDFDYTDGAVTVWDGANDTLLSGGAMKYTYSATADIGTISSSNAGDLQPITILGLDANWNEISQTVTLNGQSDVSLPTPLIRAYRMRNIGTTDFAGAIYLRTNGSAQSGGVPTVANTVRAIINDGNNQTLMAIYTVPAGKTGYLRTWYASLAGANIATSYKIRLRARNFGSVFQIKHTSALVEDGTSNIVYHYTEPEVFAEKTDIAISVQALSAGVTGGDVSAGFDLVIK